MIYETCLKYSPAHEKCSVIGGSCTLQPACCWESQGSVMCMITILCTKSLWSQICFKFGFRDKALRLGETVPCPESLGESGSLSLKLMHFSPCYAAPTPSCMLVTRLWPPSLHQHPWGVKITDDIRALAHKGAEVGPRYPSQFSGSQLLCRASGTLMAVLRHPQLLVAPVHGDPREAAPCRPWSSWTLRMDRRLGLWSEITDTHVQEKHRPLLPGESHRGRAWWTGCGEIYESHSICSVTPYGWHWVGGVRLCSNVKLQKDEFDLEWQILPWWRDKGPGLWLLSALYMRLWGPCHDDWLIVVCLFVFSARLWTPGLCISNAHQNAWPQWHLHVFVKWTIYRAVTMGQALCLAPHSYDSFDSYLPQEGIAVIPGDGRVGL